MSRLTPCRMAIGALALLLVSTGCTVERQDGDTSTFTYETWIPLVLIFVGFAAAVGGFFLRAVSTRFAWILLIGGPLAALVIGPGMFLEYASVNSEQFELRTGFWFYPNYHTVRYADLSSIQVTSEEKRGRRGRKSKSFYLVCQFKSGSEAKVPVGDLMKDGAAVKILEIADKQAIPIVVHDEW